MKNMISRSLNIMIALSILSVGSLTISAQNSMPAPGAGGNYSDTSAPAPGSGGSYTPNAPNGIGWNPGPMTPGPGWGGGMNGWYNGWNTPVTYVNPVVVNPNQGVAKVMACGFDNFGNWTAVPLVVSYSYNGVQYNVNVINAWDPISQMWNRGVDMPAYNTSYYTHGVTYNYYTPLSTGTYYFNL